MQMKHVSRVLINFICIFLASKLPWDERRLTFKIRVPRSSKNKNKTLNQKIPFRDMLRLDNERVSSSQ